MTWQEHYGGHPDNILHPDQMCESIALLPQWVYGLLRGPLLSSHTPLSAHRLSADGRTALYTLYRAIPPADLALTIAPNLDAYASADECAHRGLALSWEAIRRSGCSLFVLDAYTTIYIYLYQAAATPATDADAAVAGAERSAAGSSAAMVAAAPFPPSRSSLIWKDAAMLKQARLRSVRIVCCRHATPLGKNFESYIDVTMTADELVAEESAAGPEIVVGDKAALGVERFSFGQFLCFLRDEVKAALAAGVS